MASPPDPQLADNPIPDILSNLSSLSLKKASLSSPFLENLISDIRFIIYHFLLLQELHIEILTLAPESERLPQGHLYALSRTCLTLQKEIEIFYSKKKSCLHTMPSLNLGIHFPENTVYHLRLNTPCWKSEKIIWNNFLCTANRNLIKHLVIHDEFKGYTTTRSARGLGFWSGPADWVVLASRYLKELTSLSSIEIVLQAEQRLSVTSSDFLLSAYHALWNSFWKENSFCSPSAVCTCCVLPDLRWRFEDKFNGRLGGGLPCKEADFQENYVFPVVMGMVKWYGDDLSKREYGDSRHVRE